MFATSVVFAPHAVAGQDEYLHKLQTQFVFLSAEELIAEGGKVCSVIRNGTPSADAVIMVSEDLKVSVPTAGDIVSTAVVELGC